MKTAICLRITLLFIAFLIVAGIEPSAAAQSPGLVLGDTTVCEDVRNGIAEQPAAVFSVDLKRVYCYTDFSNVLEKSVTYHNWFFRDKPWASVKLTVQPPRWSTYSSIQLRDSEKGPWRIEISDEEGRILKILRFSVID